MILRKDQVWRCQNRACGADIHVAKNSIEDEWNPRCCCGTVMKKPYVKPVLRTLESTPELMKFLGI
jgi:hypothetical protein